MGKKGHLTFEKGHLKFEGGCVRTPRTPSDKPLAHIIFTTFGANPSLEFRHIFLYLSKGSDKVWHKGVLPNFKNIGMDGNLLILIESFCKTGFQGSFLMANYQNGETFTPEYHKDQFYDHFLPSSMYMTFNETYILMSNCSMGKLR